MKIRAASRLYGELLLPGDKSISHRYALLGAVAQGVTRLSNFSSSRDCQATLQCVQELGIAVAQEGSLVIIESGGWQQFQQPRNTLNAQNSGTTIRLISALLASGPLRSTIQGDESLNQRPMRRIIVPLTQMGAQIEAREGEFPPLTIQGTTLKGIDYVLPVASAQVKSCVLLGGLMAQGVTTVTEPLPTRDHTERALPFFGARLNREGPAIRVIGQIPLHGARAHIPCDFSAAAFFILSALLLPGSDIRILNVGMNPSRTALLDLLDSAGASIERLSARDENGEPVCDLRVRFSVEVTERFPQTIDPALIPNLIDELPALAVFGTRLRNGLCIRGAAELRRKESDRIKALCSNFERLGIQVEEYPDGFLIPAGQSFQGGRVRSYGDHRIAMAFAIAGLFSENPIEIDEPDSVAVSFPDFFGCLKKIRS
ncbi:MAG: 3-phosphoshikimate 1-carboxyvinyltransferase [Acidobacteria bacterium]|nr:3-phosphoshikimate 1-carboxyvinyltransferase [Acidobacteriota bacterium]